MNIISTTKIWDNKKHDTIIDVRSPSEFNEDHIPGAINLPVLNDCLLYTSDAADDC